MGKPIKVTSYRSGNQRLKAGEQFLYEVNLYKDYKDRVEMVSSKYYVTNKPLNIPKNECMSIEDFVLVKCVTWLEAPLDYLTKNNFIEEESGRTNSKTRARK